MAIISKQTVTTRPSLNVHFGDWSDVELAKYGTLLNDLPIESYVAYSADVLTRTRHETYDSSLQSTIDQLNATYAAALERELARRANDGVVSITSILP